MQTIKGKRKDKTTLVMQHPVKVIEINDSVTYWATWDMHQNDEAFAVEVEDYETMGPSKMKHFVRLIPGNKRKQSKTFGYILWEW